MLFSHSLYHLLLVEFLRMVILSGVRWHLIVVSICSSLIISGVEHLFTSFLAIYMTSLEKFLCRSSAHFLTREYLFFLILSCMNYLYIWRLILGWFLCLKKFSPILWVVLLFIVSFVKQKLSHITQQSYSGADICRES